MNCFGCRKAFGFCSTWQGQARLGKRQLHRARARTDKRLIPTATDSNDSVMVCLQCQHPRRCLFLCTMHVQCRMQIVTRKMVSGFSLERLTSANAKLGWMPRRRPWRCENGMQSHLSRVTMFRRFFCTTEADIGHGDIEMTIGGHPLLALAGWVGLHHQDGQPDPHVQYPSQTPTNTNKHHDELWLQYHCERPFSSKISFASMCTFNKTTYRHGPLHGGLLVRGQFDRRQ